MRSCVPAGKRLAMPGSTASRRDRMLCTIILLPTRIQRGFFGQIMRGGAKKRLSANPHDVLRSLAGLKSDSPVGFLPVVLSNPKAERALYDLRAIAMRFLDMEFLAAMRPQHIGTG